MSSWRPRTELEKEMVSLHPESNFIYGYLSDSQKKLQNNRGLNTGREYENEDSHSNGLRTIRAVQELPGARPFGVPENEDDLHNVGRETVAMIRNCGMGPSIDMLLDEKTTIPTYPISEKILVSRKGVKKFPVIMGDDYFNLETTRSRNKKVYEKLNMDDITKEMERNRLGDERKQSISVLNEKDFIISEAEVAAKKYENYILTFPELGQVKKKKTIKNVSKTDNLLKGNITSSSSKTVHHQIKNKTSPRKIYPSLGKNDSDKNSSHISNSTASSRSVYNSFETNSSNSIYLTATDSPNCSYKNHTPEKENYRNGGVSKRFYTPKKSNNWRKNI